MKTAITLLALLLWSWQLRATEPKDEDMVGEILNKACSQQLLTQRMTKAYFAVLLGLDQENQEKQLKEDILLFEANQSAIQTLLPTQTITNGVQNVSIVWLEFKPLLANINSNNAGKVLEKNTALLTLSTAVVTQIEQYGKKFSGETTSKAGSNYQNVLQLIITTGQQRALSQRILAYSLAIQAKTEYIGVKDSLQAAQRRFNNALTVLESALENTPEIDYSLVRFANDWKRFEALCANIQQLKPEELTELVSSSEVLVGEMNDIAGLYEDLIDAELTSLILSNAINKANLQTALTQQIAKAKIAEMLGIDSKEHQKELKNCIASFNANLKTLKDFAPIANAEGNLASVEKLWRAYEKLANEPSTREICIRMLNENSELYNVCQLVSADLEAYAEKLSKTNHKFNLQFSQLVNRSSNQRSLSQRVMLYCLSATWGLKSQHSEEYLYQASEEYAEALKKLMDLPENTPEINAKLKTAYDDWQEIAAMCERATIRQPDQQSKMLQQSNKVLKEMDELTGLYENLVNRMLNSEAVNKAARQRMLSQRITKSYIAIVMGIDTNNYKKQLFKDINLFENQLSELRIYASSEEQKNAFKDVANLWKTYKTILTSAPSEQGMQELLNSNNNLLNACHQGVLLLQKNSTSNNNLIANIIEISGKQRMLSQRLTMFYLAYVHFGRKDQAYLSETLKTMDEFGKGLVFLSSQKINTPKINTKIADLQRQYDKLARYKDNLNKVDFYQVWLITDNLLADSEMLTRSYEQLKP